MLSEKELVDFIPTIQAIVNQRIFDKSRREDIVQDILLRIWKYRDKFDPTRAAANTWMTMQARQFVWSTVHEGLPSPIDYPEEVPEVPQDAPHDWRRRLHELDKNPDGHWLIWYEENPENLKYDNLTRSAAHKIREKLREDYGPC